MVLKPVQSLTTFQLATWPELLSQYLGPRSPRFPQALLIGLMSKGSLERLRQGRCKVALKGYDGEVGHRGNTNFD